MDKENGNNANDDGDDDVDDNDEDRESSTLLPDPTPHPLWICSENSSDLVA